MGTRHTLMQTALLFLSPFPFYKHFRIVYGINPNSTNHSDPQQGF